MKISTLLFTSSFVAVVASAWARLDAGAHGDGPAAQPVDREIQIGGRTVAVHLDRERVPSGQPIHLTLAASASERAIDVEVAVLEQVGSRMARMMPPPVEVSRQTVRLAGGPVEVPLTLAGPPRGEDPLAVAGAARQYTITVTSAKPDPEATSAWLPVFAYEPDAYRVTVPAPTTGAPGETIDLAVEVDSLADKPLRQITIALGGNYFEVLEAATVAELAPRGHTVLHVKARRLAPPDGQPLRIDANAWAGYGGTASRWATLDPATGQVASGTNPGGGFAMGGLLGQLDIDAIEVANASINVPIDLDLVAQFATSE